MINCNTCKAKLPFRNTEEKPVKLSLWCYFLEFKKTPIHYLVSMNN